MDKHQYGKKRFVVFGRKDSDEEWQETILLSDATQEQIDKILPEIKADGWKHLRFVETEKLTPDFGASSLRKKK